MKVVILPKVHAQIMHYVHNSDVEISGLGRVERASDGTLVVTKVYLPKQENAATSTDIDQEAISQLLFESREDKGSLTFWWHSHVNMGAFWSGTDMDTMREFGSKGYILATVFNKKGEHKTAYFQGANDFLPEVFVDNIETSFRYVPTEKEAKEWTKLMEENCKKKVYEMPKGLDVGGFDKWRWQQEDMFNPNDPFAWKDDIPMPAKKADIGINSGWPMDMYLDLVQELLLYDNRTFDALDHDEKMCVYDAYEDVHQTITTLKDRAKVANWYNESSPDTINKITQLLERVNGTEVQTSVTDKNANKEANTRGLGHSAEAPNTSRSLKASNNRAKPREDKKRGRGV